MTRECSTDFEKITTYVGKYNISENLGHPEYVQALKIMHKCYFSAITWSAELHYGKQEFLKIYTNSNDDICFRLSEAVSDLGSSFFNWINGNYKASRVMLRVSIENFIRATSAVENKSQLTEKSVFQLFDVASGQSIFSDTVNPSIRRCYESLHGDYKLLCEDAHTATTQNMEHLTSLADLPAFQVVKSNNAAEIYIRASKNITSIFCILFNSFFHKMHHRNRENILNGLNRDLRPVVIAPQS